MNDKREIWGWVMYDWANSTFSTTVATALLGPYIIALAEASPTPITVLAIPIQPAAIFPFAVSLSVILQVFFLPILGTVADFTHLKKRMMLAFAYSGATATILLLFVYADFPIGGHNGAVILGSALFVLANLCFGAAVVFYNAFLPEIVSPDRRDAVSSQGFAMGYLGGGLLLLGNLALLTMMADTALAVRLSLFSAGAWWLIFTYLYPHRLLRQRRPARQLPPGAGFVTTSLQQLRRTLLEMRRKYPMTLRYLLAYLVYNDGIQTVIVVATSFAFQELGVGNETLLLLVLMIQFIAFGGAFFFGWLATRIGTKPAIMSSLVVWAGLVIYAYFFLYTEVQLFVMGAVLALVLGGSQALSRSLYSQMIPPGQEAEFFGFYEISERGTSWIGPLAFGAAVMVTQSQRIAIVTLIFFFIVGLALLSRVDVARAIADAGRDTSDTAVERVVHGHS